MKQFFFTLLLTLVVGVCDAQTEHMKFMGIPMDGTLQSFTNKLKAKGFTPIGSQILTGEFAGYKGCTIGTFADKSGMVCKVSVIFPKMEKWGELERCYNNYKSMLTEKYGEPQECIEEFQNRNPRDDNDRIYELSMDRCKYHTSFVCDNGGIEIEISHQGYSSYFVMLTYYDNANQERLRKQIMDDL